MFLQRGICGAVWMLGLAVPATAVGQQSLSQNALKIERHVAQLAPDAKISVIPYQGREEFGRFVSRTAEGFTFHDVDSGTDVTMKYEEVKHLRNGYGGYNSITGRHVDRQRSRIFGAVFLAALLGGLLVALALSPN